MIEELLRLISNIKKEIKDLDDYGDIPWDSRDDINEWLKEAEGIIRDYDR